MGSRLSEAFYRNPDVLEVARQLLGKCLFARINGELTGGIIVETEAYRGPDDRGSHAWNDRRTPRNEMMYAAGGLVYMYICYGIHDMLNIVTGAEGSSHAVLIRALEPTQGIDVMTRRRMTGDVNRLCKGPGALGRALGLTRADNGVSLQGDRIWIEDAPELPESQIRTSPRIGMNFEGPYKTIPWRFSIAGNRFVSGRKV